MEFFDRHGVRDEGHAEDTTLLIALHADQGDWPALEREARSALELRAEVWDELTSCVSPGGRDHGGARWQKTATPAGFENHRGPASLGETGSESNDSDDLGRASQGVADATGSKVASLVRVARNALRDGDPIGRQKCWSTLRNRRGGFRRRRRRRSMSGSKTTAVLTLIPIRPQRGSRSPSGRARMFAVMQANGAVGAVFEAPPGTGGHSAY